MNARLTSREVILKARDLRKYYGSGESQVHALDDVSLDIHSGELLIILGSSGSGKTTLLNLLGGMTRPDSGSLLFRGQELARRNEKELTQYRRDHVGFVFQSFNLIPELTVTENIALTAPGDPEAVAEAIRLTELQDKTKAYPSQLSGGQQQRVSIARALAKNCDLLLCDEPTGALDYETGRQILIRLEELSRIHGRTVIIVTHSRDIARMGDRTITLRNGKILSEETRPDPVSARNIEW